MCGFESQSRAQLTLRELRATASTAETWLLAFFHTRIARQEALLAELGVQVAVVLHQGAGNALHAGAGLARAAAAVNAESLRPRFRERPRDPAERATALRSCCTLKKSSSGRLLIVSLPLPSRMRTRATEVLRRPVPRASMTFSAVGMGKIQGSG